MPELNITRELRSVVCYGMNLGGVAIIATEGLNAVITIQYNGKSDRIAQIVSTVNPTMKNTFSARVPSRKNCGTNWAKRFLGVENDLSSAVWFMRIQSPRSPPGIGGLPDQS